MREDDLGRVEEIWCQESVRIHNWMDDPEDFWNRRRHVFRKDTINRADVKSVFVEDGNIKGFITGKENHIWELFVDQQYQRKGIGSKLITSLTETKPLLSVNVYMLNHKAIKFYIKKDFVITKLYTEKGTGFTKFLMEWTKESLTSG
jgi:ribosomal protein S18 acetylase RimI-like enzyme